MGLREILDKASVRAVLALLFGGTACAAFLLSKISEENFIEALILCLVFYFREEK